MNRLSESRRVKKEMANRAFAEKYANRWSEEALGPPRAVAPLPPNPNSSLTIASWITLGVGCLFWPLLLVSFILGVILAAKGAIGHGVAVMVLSLLAPVIVLGVIFA